MKYQANSPAHAARMTRDEMLLAQAEQHAEFFRAQLANNPDDVDFANGLAEALTILGESEEAETVAPTAEAKSMVRFHAFAAEVDDDAMCDCANDTVDKVEGGVNFGTEEQTRFIELRRVFSPKHGKVIPVWQCTKCGWTNATPDPPDMLTAKRQDAIASAHRAYVGKNAE